MIVGYLTARKIMKLTVAQSLGGICGGMTSTPALGAIVSKTNQQGPHRQLRHGLPGRCHHDGPPGQVF